MPKPLTLKLAHTLHPLAPSVLRQLGGGREAIQSAIDAANNGADGGFAGFTYSNEILPWFRRNKLDIRSSVSTLASDLSTDPISLVRGFGCLTDKRKAIRLNHDLDRSTVTTEEVASVLYGDGSDAGEMHSVIVDALAWFALEEVGRAFSDYLESQD